MLLVDRRTALTGLVAGGLGPLIGPLRPGQAGPASMVERYPTPVEITADDIAWFRACRALWIEGECGAPAVVPASMPRAASASFA